MQTVTRCQLLCPLQQRYLVIFFGNCVIEGAFLLQRHLLVRKGAEQKKRLLEVLVLDFYVKDTVYRICRVIKRAYLVKTIC